MNFECISKVKLEYLFKIVSMKLTIFCLVFFINARNYLENYLSDDFITEIKVPEDF